MTMIAPAISALMPVHNGARFLAEAVDSVLDQSFRDFELLAIDDGSTDRTAEILNSYRDPRLRVVSNGRNLGLIASLNLGLDLARGEFVARMDSDDICHRRRFEVQLAYLRDNIEIGVVGSWYRSIGTYRWTRAVRMPVHSPDVHAWMMFHSPIAHPTALIRREVVKRHRLYYDPAYLHAEDYELWSRAAGVTRLANLPRVLLRYRMHAGQVTSQFARAQSESGKLVRRRELTKLKPDVTDDEADFHNKIVTSTFERDADSLARVEEWFRLLVERNRLLDSYDRQSFDRAISRVWMRAALDCMPNSWAYRRYLRSPLTALTRPRAGQLLGFGARAFRELVA